MRASLTVETTVPTTRPSCISGSSRCARESSQVELELRVARRLDQHVAAGGLLDLLADLLEGRGGPLLADEQQVDAVARVDRADHAAGRLVEERVREAARLEGVGAEEAEVAAARARRLVLGVHRRLAAEGRRDRARVGEDAALQAVELVGRLGPRARHL